MFVHEDIPSNYNKIAEISDNYIILVRESTLNSNNTYDAYIQFFSPSVMYEHLTNYTISNGSKATYDVNYTNNGMYSYIDSIDAYYELKTMSLDSITNDYYDRPDLPVVLYAQFLLVFLMCKMTLQAPQ